MICGLVKWFGVALVALLTEYGKSGFKDCLQAIKSDAHELTLYRF
jgi:hypothetical protein